MDSNRHETCKSCHRRMAVGVAPDPSGNCERCAELAIVARVSASPEVPERVMTTDEDSPRRAIVDRLRRRYEEAKRVVAAEPPPETDHSHLDWILGSRRSPDRNDAEFDTEISELVVLWLDDLVRQLDGWSSPSDTSCSAVRDLRSATREFAQAFLAPRVPPAEHP